MRKNNKADRFFHPYTLKKKINIYANNGLHFKKATVDMLFLLLMECRKGPLEMEAELQ